MTSSDTSFQVPVSQRAPSSSLTWVSGSQLEARWTPGGIIGRGKAAPADAATPPARLRARRYVNAALLLIDEIGFRPLDRLEANLFFRLVSLRYERGSLLLTSNKHVRDWPEIFAGDEILTTAILDRLLHHVAVVHIDGQSYRLRELGALLSPNREVPRGPESRSNDPR